VIETFFATSFSDLFRLKINSKIMSIDRDHNAYFSERKQLLHERIRDHFTYRMRCASVCKTLRGWVAGIGFT